MDCHPGTDRRRRVGDYFDGFVIPDGRGCLPEAPRPSLFSWLASIVGEPRFHGHLTGRENLKILAAARGGDAGKQIGPALDRTRLT